MKTSNTLLLLVIALGLVAFVYFYERKIPTTKEAERRAAYVIEVDRDKIDGIEITNNEDVVKLQKRDNKWFLEAPVKDRADESVTTQLFTSLEMLRKENVVPNAEMKEYGLSNPTLRLKLLGADAPPELQFGKDAATEGKVYLRTAKSKDAYVVSNELKNQLVKRADDFRDHRLSDLNTTQVQKVIVKNEAGEMELERKGEDWRINKPLQARADSAKVRDLISKLLNARIDTFVSKDNAAAETGLSQPRGTVTMHSEGEEQPLILQIGGASEKDAAKIYAHLSSRDSTYLLPPTIEEPLKLKPNDLRDRKLVQLQLDTVDRINIQPVGKPKITLARKEETWTIKSDGDKPGNAAEVQRLVEKLKTSDVADFVSDTASDLAPYGLDKPQLQISFSAFASENTAETKAGEKPLVTVAFGKEENGKVFAKLDDEPFVVSVEKAVLESVFVEPTQWRDLAILRLKPDDIVSLEVTRSGTPPLALKREGGTWKTGSGEAKVSENNVTSLLNTLSSLRAVRWARPDETATGPTANLVLKFSTADNASHQLTVGESTPENMYLSSLAGTDGKFVVSKPDADALQLSLVQSEPMAPAAASPSPSAPPSLSPAG